jgi:hypothetical protein
MKVQHPLIRRFTINVRNVKEDFQWSSGRLLEAVPAAGER